MNGKQVYNLNFVDFEKAFDSIHRESLWTILKEYGIPTTQLTSSDCFMTDFNVQQMIMERKGLTSKQV